MMSTKNINRKRGNGFTLVELVTVILLLGILTAVAAPRFFDSRSFQDRGLYDEVVAAVRYGQKVAVASGCPVEVRMNIGGDAYGLYQKIGCTSGVDLPVVEPAGSGPYRKALADVPAGLILLPSITFDPLGRAVSGVGTHNLALAGRTVIVVSETGYVYTP